MVRVSGTGSGTKQFDPGASEITFFFLFSFLFMGPERTYTTTHADLDRNGKVVGFATHKSGHGHHLTMHVHDLKPGKRKRKKSWEQPFNFFGPRRP